MEHVADRAVVLAMLIGALRSNDDFHPRRVNWMGGIGSRIEERRDRGRASRFWSALMSPSRCVVEGVVRLDDVRVAASPCEKEEREGVVCLPSLDA